jgi:membrane peptidoglycan carboxypeptidase
MFDSQKGPGRRRPSKSVYTTKSGNTIKLNRSLGERVRANREAKARKRAAYLSSLPRNRWKRLLYKLHPKRVAKYWFSREGAIMALKLIGIGIVALFLLMVGIFAYFRKDLPNIKDISGNELGGSITYYDRTGQTVLWQDYDAVKRVPVTSDKISKYVKDATIAIEDKNFYKHGAFDVAGISRAAINDVFKKGGAKQGGSTITQQLVKLNQNWTQDRSLTRKFKELILAVELEREYSKDDILTGYLNIAPYGNVQYGVESASQDYFAKPAKDLTLPESAMLAAIPQAPSYYSPYGPVYEAEALVGRQHYILDQMAKQGMITDEEAKQAKTVDVVGTVKQAQPKYEGIKAPYFVGAAKDELEQRFGDQTVKRGGWKVTTTLDMRLQDLAEQQVAKGMRQIKSQGGDAAAFASVDVKTGQMVALVGGPDFNDPVFGKVNYAKQWLPPGSSFKPYDYATFLDQETNNAGAGSVIYDNQAALPGYPCTNKARPKDGGNCLTDYDFRYPGPVTIRYALAGSRNVPAVKAMLMAGAEKVRSTAEAMGLASGYRCPPPGDTTYSRGTCYGSAAIGDGAFLHLDEHANALATLSRMGNAVPQTYILKINDARGKTIEEWKQPKGKQVIKPDTAYIIDDILSDPKASYLRTDRKFHNYKGWKFAIKTGTTNDAKDGLMASFSTQYASVVWVGHHQRQKEMTGAMENMTQPIVQGWMQGAHDPLKPVNWTKPTDVKMMPAYVVRSKLSNLGESIPSPGTDLFPAWYKEPSKQGGTSQTIDKVSGKLATSCTPEGAKESQSGGNDNIFSVDTYMKKGTTTTTTEQDNVHNCDDAKPQITLTAPASCSALCSFTVTVTQGTHPLTGDKFSGTVELFVNGQKVQGQNVSSSPSTITFSYMPTATGNASVEARITDSVLYTASMSSEVSMTQ